MIESNDIWSVIKFIWDWCETTVWYEGSMFGKPVEWNMSLFFYVPLIASFVIFVIRLVFWLMDE